MLIGSTAKDNAASYILVLLVRAREAYLAAKASHSLEAQLVVDLEEVFVGPAFIHFFDTVVAALLTPAQKAVGFKGDTVELRRKETVKGVEGANPELFGERAPSWHQSAVFTFLQGGEDEQQRVLTLFDTLIAVAIIHHDRFNPENLDKNCLPVLKDITVPALAALRHQAKPIFYAYVLRLLDLQMARIADEGMMLSTGLREFTLSHESYTAVPDEVFASAQSYEIAWEAQLIAAANDLMQSQQSAASLSRAVSAITAVQRMRISRVALALNEALVVLSFEDIEKAILAAEEQEEDKNYHSALLNIFKLPIALMGLRLLKQSFAKLSSQDLEHCSPKFMACYRGLSEFYGSLCGSLLRSSSNLGEQPGIAQLEPALRQRLEKAALFAGSVFKLLDNYYRFTEYCAANLTLLQQHWDSLGSIKEDAWLAEQHADIRKGRIGGGYERQSAKRWRDLALEKIRPKEKPKLKSIEKLLAPDPVLLQKYLDRKKNGVIPKAPPTSKFPDIAAPRTKLQHQAFFLGHSQYSSLSYGESTAYVTGHLKRLLHILLLAQETTAVEGKIKITLEDEFSFCHPQTDFMLININTLCKALGFKACASQEQTVDSTVTLIFAVDKAGCGFAQGLDFNAMLAAVILLFDKVKISENEEWQQKKLDAMPAGTDRERKRLLRQEYMNAVQRHLLAPNKGKLPKLFSNPVALEKAVDKAFKKQCEKDVENRGRGKRKKGKQEAAEAQKQALAQLEKDITADISRLEHRQKQQQEQQSHDKEETPSEASTEGGEDKPVDEVAVIRKPAYLSEVAKFFGNVSKLEPQHSDELVIHQSLLCQLGWYIKVLEGKSPATASRVAALSCSIASNTKMNALLGDGLFGELNRLRNTNVLPTSPPVSTFNNEHNRLLSEMAHRAVFFGIDAYPNAHPNGVDVKNSLHVQRALQVLVIAQQAIPYHGKVAVTLEQGLSPTGMAVDFMVANFNALHTAFGGKNFITAEKNENGSSRLVFSVDKAGCGLENGPDYDSLMAGMLYLFDIAKNILNEEWGSNIEEAATTTTTHHLVSRYLVMPGELSKFENREQLFAAARKAFEKYFKATKKILENAAEKKEYEQRKTDMEKAIKADAPHVEKRRQQQLQRRNSGSESDTGSSSGTSTQDVNDLSDDSNSESEDDLSEELRKEIRGMAEVVALKKPLNNQSRYVPQTCLRRVLRILLDAHGENKQPPLSLRDVDGNDWTREFLSHHLAYMNDDVTVSFVPKGTLDPLIDFGDSGPVTLIYHCDGQVDLEVSLLTVMGLMTVVGSSTNKERCVTHQYAEDSSGSAIEEGLDLFEKHGMDEWDSERLFEAVENIYHHFAPVEVEEEKPEDNPEVRALIEKCHKEREQDYEARMTGMHSPFAAYSILDVGLRMPNQYPYTGIACSVPQDLAYREEWSEERLKKTQKNNKRLEKIKQQKSEKDGEKSSEARNIVSLKAGLDMRVFNKGSLQPQQLTQKAKPDKLNKRKKRFGLGRRGKSRQLETA